MKITRFNLQIFVSELETLSNEIPDVKKSAESWLTYQEQREKYGWQDQEGTAASRSVLEDKLTEIRHRIALVYDFMSDRGLVNFEPTQMEAIQNGEGGYDLGGNSEGTELPTGQEEKAGVPKLLRLLQERNQSSDSEPGQANNAG